MTMKHITTIKLEHTVDEIEYPKLLLMTEEERQRFFDRCAKGMIEELLVKANEGGTHSFLNLVRE